MKLSYAAMSARREKVAAMKVKRVATMAIGRKKIAVVGRRAPVAARGETVDDVEAGRVASGSLERGDM